MDPTQKVKLYPKTSLARVWFSSPELVEALSQWGIVPRKTLMIAWPDTFPSNLIPAYIRGYFDGDGTLMKRRRVWRGAQRSEIVCRFTSGSIQFLEGLEQELQVRGIRTLKRYSNGPNTHVLPISVISSISWRFCIINLAHDWLEKRVETIFEPNLSLIKWRDILSHLFDAVQK